jgi:hypothetical protein
MKHTDYHTVWRLCGLRKRHCHDMVLRAWGEAVGVSCGVVAEGDGRLVALDDAHETRGWVGVCRLCLASHSHALRRLRRTPLAALTCQKRGAVRLLAYGWGTGSREGGGGRLSVSL